MNLKKIYDKLDKIEDNELKGLIIELIEENDKLNMDIQLDELTGTYNRRILDHIKYNCSIAMCDIDGFKEINDKNGHDYGDLVLKLFASTIKSSIRSDDIVIRYGGDEFVILFKNCPINIAKKRLEEIRNNLKDKNISFSSGIAKFDNNRKIDKVIEEADSALYDSKRNGKNQTTIYKK